MLRKGPVIISFAVLSAVVGLAFLIAFSPRNDKAQAQTAPQGLADEPTKNIVLPDAVRDAPGNNADLHQVPRLGPANRGADQSTPAGDSPRASRQRLEQTLREQRSKALASPILVDVENPAAPDRTPPVQPIASVSAGEAPAPSPVDGVGRSEQAGADPNLQQRKNNFLSRDGTNNTSYLSQPMLAPRSPYEVKAGTVIPATLITGINSDLPGQIVGQVRENVYDTVTGDYLLIPQGSRLIATYDSSIAFGQSRVLVCWNRLIRPDGISVTLECMPGVDLSGYAGFADDVDHHWGRIISGVALGTLLSATAQRSQGDVSGYNPTVPQLWASNAGASLNQAGQQITQKNLQIQPTVKVRPGFSVNVLVNKDIILQPYGREGSR